MKKYHSLLIITLVALFPFIGYCQQKSIKLPRPIDMVGKIFTDYTKHGGNADSEENMIGMQNALSEMLNADKQSNEALIQLIDVWMYYTPKDFPTGRFVEPILFKNKQESLVAIDSRLKNKKKGESDGAAPYSDLIMLKKRLIESH